MQEVWITGAGAVSALGRGLPAHIAAVRDARSGVATHEFFGGKPPDPCVCGMVPREVLPADIEESSRDRATLLLHMACADALSCAGLEPGIQADVCAGTTLGNMHAGTSWYKQVCAGAGADASALEQFLPCAPVHKISDSLHLHGKRWTIASACGSASAALGHAFHLIRHGLSSRCIAGGFEALSPFVIAGFNSLQLISAQRCKPFDVNRSGLNPGEAAAIFVLESAQSAAARGARPLATIRGFGDALDAYHHTAAHPEGAGLVRAIQCAMQRADLRCEEIDHIHLHGTGTRINDASEYSALEKIFGTRLAAIPACSTKPMTGHTFGASGALNAVFTLVTLTCSVVPPTLFHEHTDPAFTHLKITSSPQHTATIKTVLSTSLGFGGEAFSLIFSKAEA